jgi:hypothetical protein
MLDLKGTAAAEVHRAACSTQRMRLYTGASTRSQLKLPKWQRGETTTLSRARLVSGPIHGAGSCGDTAPPWGYGCGIVVTSRRWPPSTPGSERLWRSWMPSKKRRGDDEAASMNARKSGAPIGAAQRVCNKWTAAQPPKPPRFRHRLVGSASIARGPRVGAFWRDTQKNASVPPRRAPSNRPLRRDGDSRRRILPTTAPSSPSLHGADSLRRSGARFQVGLDS